MSKYNLLRRIGLASILSGWLIGALSLAYSSSAASLLLATIQVTVLAQPQGF